MGGWIRHPAMLAAASMGIVAQPGFFDVRDMAPLGDIPEPGYRSKRRPQKRKKHPNRLTISKRVRRKHRRARR